MEAVRVPPSAWITSQSTVMVRSPSARIRRRRAATADQALDLEGAPALLAARGLAGGARVGGARQHAVLGGDPALPLPAGRGARGPRRSRCRSRGCRRLDQDRAFGVPGEPRSMRMGRSSSGARPLGLTLESPVSDAVRCRASARPAAVVLSANGAESCHGARAPRSPRRSRRLRPPSAACKARRSVSSF